MIGYMVTMSLHLDDALFRRIEAIARRFGRSVEDTAADLLMGSVDEDYIAAVEQGLRDVNAGRTVTHDEVERYVQAKLRGENPEKPTWK